MNQDLPQEEVLKMNLIHAVHLYIQKGRFDKSNTYREVKTANKRWA